MTLGTHAIIGAAVASTMPEHPVLGFCAGFISHFIADAIPHYDYPIYSESIHPKKRERHMHFNSALFRDFADFSFDAGAGLLVALAAFSFTNAWLAIILGAIGGILPDPLQFVAKIWPRQPLNSLQRFHQWIHTDHRMRDRGELMLGIVSQLAVILCTISVAWIIYDTFQ
jgi:hypothetical protein